MDPHPGAGAASLSVRPSPSGIVLGVVLVVAAVFRPAVADPAIAGFLWAGMLGVLVVGFAWPVLTVRRTSVRVVGCPTDLLVGLPGHLELAVSKTGVPLDVALDDSVGRLSSTANGVAGRAAPPHGAEHVRTLTVVVNRRGVYERLPLLVTLSAPFGLVRVQRRYQCELRHPLYVGPMSTRETARPEEAGAGNRSPVVAGRGQAGDTVRSVRPYVAGDPAHLVHWPTSARLAELVVRELEPPPTRAVAIVVDLRGPASDPGDAGAAPRTRRRTGTIQARESAAAVEALVSRAAGAAESALLQGHRVLLCTAEPSGPVARELGSDLALRRGLAAAGSGAPGVPPPGWTVVSFP